MDFAEIYDEIVCSVFIHNNFLFLEKLREFNESYIPLSKKCDPDPNVLNLVIWFDGSAFKKTGKSGKIWSMMVMIADLDPKLRSRLENLVTFFHLGVSVANNNLFCEKYMESFKNLMDCGIEITINGNVRKLVCKIMILIADNVAFPKVFNCNQYNGFFGCIKCLHPVQSIKKPRQKRVYIYSDKFPLRTQAEYENAVKIATQNNTIYQGKF